MKLLNKKISPEEEKKLAEDLSQLLVQNSGFSDAIGKSLEIMKEDVEKSKEEAENPNASDTMYRLKDNVFTYLTKFFQQILTSTQKIQNEYRAESK